MVERISRQVQRVWEDRLRGNNRVVIEGKGLQAESFQQISENKLVGREETS